MKNISIKYDNNNKKNQSKIDNNIIIPPEIDTHFQMYGKHVWEVEYGDKCPICERRIDEFGYCACGSQGE